jgi:hypothetical protein
VPLHEGAPEVQIPGLSTANAPLRLTKSISMRKTGSSSLKEFLSHAQRERPDLYGDVTTDILEENILDPSCARQLHDSHTTLLFTSLRDPAERHHSECYYSGPCAVFQPDSIDTYRRWRAEHVGYPIFLNFSDVYMEPCTVNGGRYVDNYHVRRLGGNRCTQQGCSVGLRCVESGAASMCAGERNLGGDDLALAKEALMSHHVVLVTDMMNVTFPWLSRCLGVAEYLPYEDHPEGNNLVPHPEETALSSTELRDWLNHDNALDVALLRWARERLSNLLSTSGPTFPTWCPGRPRPLGPHDA